MSDQKISIDIRLAIQWRFCNDVDYSNKIDFNNAPAIQLLEVLDSQKSPKLLKSISNTLQENSSGQSELARLESKLDLLILLFTRNQYTQQQNNLSNFEVNLTADTIKIKTTKSGISKTFVVNQLLELDIYFNQNCPEPLVFLGKVVALDNDDTVSINFYNVGSITQDFLEKYIFRQHRNEIAQIKHN